MERVGEGVGEVGRGSDLSFEVIGSLKVRKYNKKCVVGQIDPPPVPRPKSSKSDIKN